MSEQAFVNLTPHAIVVVGGPTIPPSGKLARCVSSSVSVGEHAGVSLCRTSYGAVDGLPDPEAGVIYIVSALVRAAVPHRADVASPGELVRDAAGSVIGCKGLSVN